MIVACPICHALFNNYTGHRPRKTCSDPCARRYAHRHNAAYAAKHRARRQAMSPPSPLTFVSADPPPVLPELPRD